MGLLTTILFQYTSFDADYARADSPPLFPFSVCGFHAALFWFLIGAGLGVEMIRNGGSRQVLVFIIIVRC